MSEHDIIPDKEISCEEFLETLKKRLSQELADAMNAYPKVPYNDGCFGCGRKTAEGESHKEKCIFLQITVVPVGKE